MIKIESLGSYWWLDFDHMTYARSPKFERPQPNGWGKDPKDPALHDLRTYPMMRVEFITDHPGLKFWPAAVAVLRIYIRGSVRETPLGRGSWIHCPLTQAQYETAKEQLAWQK